MLDPSSTQEAGEKVQSPGVKEEKKRKSHLVRACVCVETVLLIESRASCGRSVGYRKKEEEEEWKVRETKRGGVFHPKVIFM
jgi:hypothetical protein